MKAIHSLATSGINDPTPRRSSESR